MPPGGLSKLCPLDSRHRQPIRIVLLYVCWRVENGRPSEEKLIRDKFNLEALTVNQVKVSKLWQTEKMFSPSNDHSWAVWFQLSKWLKEEAF